ncbi:MAG TPA: NUDIX hydrolase [Acidimicrobiales bacterium]|nr:NUDIX hydrolase [Acidimicrobiales bacterium]
MSPPNNASFRFLGERVRHAGFFFQLTTGTFLDPNGYTFEREIVRHPGAVCVVALEGDPISILMVRQYRGALDRSILEIPAGKLDIPDEPIELAAERELAEEIGRKATRLSKLGSFLNSPGFTDELTTCFLAEGLVPIERDAHGIEEEFMSVVAVPMFDFWRMVRNGEIVDAKTIIAVTYAERVLDDRTAR